MSTDPNSNGSVEFSPGFKPRPASTHVLFDFDGTLSLLREGWPKVMIQMFEEMLPPLPDESPEERRALCSEDIMRLNGKQTIYQMIQLSERIADRKGNPRDPLWYKHEYLRRLNSKIASRLQGIKEGKLNRDDFLVHNARTLLDNLQQRGLSLWLASGTDEIYVKQEAELLDLARYFGDNIYGAIDDYQKTSKKLIINRLLHDNKINGDNLVSFGDGYVEIQNTKEVGGLAIAVASDEANNGSGNIDPWKRQRLLGVGADVVIPDYRDTPALLQKILGE